MQNASVPVRVVHETDSIEMLRSMVANGFGVGLLATDLPDGPCYDGSPVIRVPLDGRPRKYQVPLAHRGAAFKRPITQAFIAFAETCFSLPPCAPGGPRR
ncbi:LysR substrate-binding domain-containing protein [Tritonibacter mobilis]|uniref:LysR substrate-binding domain-containing protein n=1 Tax=Tritonibacter mobilis TaxID=379347 RepID=UPI00080684D5|nr:LysR substrate-binding domain-containing protein [Tritonibacter mobilis]